MDRPEVAGDGSGGRRRPVFRVEALPVDGWARMRIDPAIDVDVEFLTDAGVEGRSSSPLAAGRRVSLGFPDSPFLPPRGTVAFVRECAPEQSAGGAPASYRLRLEYEAIGAA